MSDSGKKPPENPVEDLPEPSEEDIFLKTKVGSSSSEALQESPSETIDSFETLDDIQLNEVEGDQSVPSFNTAPIDELSSQEPEHQQFAPEFSASMPQPGEAVQGVSNTKTIDSIKNYSESLNVEAAASAQLPFTLRIEGRLTVQEAEKLLDVLSREKMDIREVDLEPQLEAGRVLIPRISEYAGVMLIQALRGVRAKIYFQPSDVSGDHLSDSAPPSDFNATFEEQVPSVAESLPVTQGDDLPQLGMFQVIDTLIVSGMLSTRSVEALNSGEFTTLTEALMRELKFKAVRRGARGITHLSVQLTPMTLPTDYRVTVSGTAVS